MFCFLKRRIRARSGFSLSNRCTDQRYRVVWSRRRQPYIPTDEVAVGGGFFGTTCRPTQGDFSIVPSKFPRRNLVQQLVDLASSFRFFFSFAASSSGVRPSLSSDGHIVRRLVFKAYRSLGTFVLCNAIQHGGCCARSSESPEFGNKIVGCSSISAGAISE